MFSADLGLHSPHPVPAVQANPLPDWPVVSLHLACIWPARSAHNVLGFSLLQRIVLILSGEFMVFG